MKKIALTGASGFIGRHVALSLVSKGHAVYLLDKRFDSDVLAMDAHRVELDFFDYSALESFFAEARPECLIHLAWNTKHGEYWSAEDNYRWLQASIEMALSFHKHGGKRLVAAGSCAEYDWNHEIMSELKTPRTPSTPYGVCKNALFQVLESFAKSKKISFAWARLFFIFGPHEKPERLIPYFICSLLKKERARCLNPEISRDFLFVKDAASAFTALAENFEARGPFNISSGGALKLREVINMITRFTGGAELIEYGAGSSFSNEPAVMIGDNSRILRETGWRPSTPMEEAIHETVRWWAGVRN